MNNVFGMVLLYVMSIVFLTSSYDEDSKRIMDMCFLVDTIVLVFMFIFGNTVQVAWGERQTLVIFGTPTDANEFAGFFIIGISVALKLFFENEKKVIKVISILAVILSVYVVMLTASRGALIAILVSTFIISTQNMNIKKAAIIFVAIVVFLICFVMFILPNIPDTSLQRITIESLAEDGGSGRTSIWSSAINSFFTGDVLRIFFGYGYCRFGVTTGFGYSEMMMHNQFLQQLISYGFLGLFLYILVVIKCEEIYRKHKRDFRSIFYGLLLMSMTLTMGPSYKIFWIIIFLAMMQKSEITPHKIEQCRMEN